MENGNGKNEVRRIDRQQKKEGKDIKQMNMIEKREENKSKKEK